MPCSYQDFQNTSTELHNGIKQVPFLKAALAVDVPSLKTRESTNKAFTESNLSKRSAWLDSERRDSQNHSRAKNEVRTAPESRKKFPEIFLRTREYFADRARWVGPLADMVATWRLHGTSDGSGLMTWWVTGQVTWRMTERHVVLTEQWHVVDWMMTSHWCHHHLNRPRTEKNWEKLGFDKKTPILIDRYGSPRRQTEAYYTFPEDGRVRSSFRVD